MDKITSRRCGLRWSGSIVITRMVPFRSCAGGSDVELAGVVETHHALNLEVAAKLEKG